MLGHLVEYDELGPVYEHSCKREPLLLPERELVA